MSNDVQILIENEGKYYYPAVLDGVELETELRDTPGKLTFKVLKDETLNFREGNNLKLTVNGVDVFCGFVFTKKRDKNNIITVTAYDQLRYLKNKHAYVYDDAGEKASTVIVNLAKDFQLKTGQIADTEYVIPPRVEDNVTVFDIIGNAIALTWEGIKKNYILYDDVGKLTLKDIEDESLRLNLLICDETAEDFDYTSTIDENTYNRVMLIQEDHKTGKRQIYIAPQDEHEFVASENIKKWGVLQYFDTMSGKEAANPQDKANNLLELYNSVTRTLTISNAFGDVRVRAGRSLLCKLELGDVSLSQYMVVTNCRHTFDNDHHYMTLRLKGGEING